MFVTATLIMSVFLAGKVESAASNVMVLGSEAVKQFRNIEVKTTIAIQQGYLNKKGFRIQSIEMKSPFKDIGNIRGGVGIPDEYKSAIIHYRITKQMSDCSLQNVLSVVAVLRGSLDGLIPAKMYKKSERKLSRNYERFLKQNKQRLNDFYPDCELDFRAVHERSVYAMIDPNLKENTQLILMVKVLNHSRRTRKNIKSGHGLMGHRLRDLITTTPALTEALYT